MKCDTGAWLDRETAACHFANERSGKRLRTLLYRLVGAMGGSIPLACRDWALTDTP